MIHGGGGPASTRVLGRTMSVRLRLPNEPRSARSESGLHDRVAQALLAFPAVDLFPHCFQQRLAFTSALIREALLATKKQRRRLCLSCMPGQGESRATIV